MIIETISQDKLASMDAVDVHNLLVGPVDHVVIEYHCGNDEKIDTLSGLMAARDRIRFVEANN